jgi:hypothetical protein
VDVGQPCMDISFRGTNGLAGKASDVDQAVKSESRVSGRAFLARLLTAWDAVLGIERCHSRPSVAFTARSGLG